MFIGSNTVKGSIPSSKQQKFHRDKLNQQNIAPSEFSKAYTHNILKRAQISKAQSPIAKGFSEILEENKSYSQNTFMNQRPDKQNFFSQPDSFIQNAHHFNFKNSSIQQFQGQNRALIAFSSLTDNQQSNASSFFLSCQENARVPFQQISHQSQINCANTSKCNQYPQKFSSQPNGKEIQAWQENQKQVSWILTFDDQDCENQFSFDSQQTSSKATNFSQNYTDGLQRYNSSQSSNTCGAISQYILQWNESINEGSFAAQYSPLNNRSQDCYQTKPKMQEFMKKHLNQRLGYDFDQEKDKIQQQESEDDDILLSRISLQRNFSTATQNTRQIINKKSYEDQQNRRAALTRTWNLLHNRLLNQPMYQNSLFAPVMLQTLQQNEDYPEVSTEAVANIVAGREPQHKLLLIDSRFTYEFQGGHIKGAINVTDPYQLQKLIFYNSQDLLQNYENKQERIVIIFHCQFSSKRGPTMFRLMREMDRTIAGAEHYPIIMQPQMYVMKGGYSQFYSKYPVGVYQIYFISLFQELCQGNGYTTMENGQPKCKKDTLSYFDNMSKNYRKDIKQYFRR